jgi:Transposase zinc-ribbon domain
VQHFLLSRAAKTLSLAQVFRMTDGEAETTFKNLRWADTNGAPVCPACGSLDAYEAQVGRHGVEELLNVVADPNDKRVPEIARACLSAFGAQLRRIKEQILEFDRLIKAWHPIQRDEHEAR